VGEAEAVEFSHVPEPRAGSIFSSDGERADLFNFRHYPVHAVCRGCGERIQAESFFRPFLHTDASPAKVYEFRARDCGEPTGRRS
jgi:hypothetical protein